MRSSMLKACVSALAVFALLPVGFTAATASAADDPATNQVCTDVPDQFSAVPEGELQWSLKKSWIKYMKTTAFGAHWELADNASWDGKNFKFPVKGGSYNNETKEATVNYSGKVHFLSHPSEKHPGTFILDMTLSNPTVVVDSEGNGSISFETVSRDEATEVMHELGRLKFHNLKTKPLHQTNHRVHFRASTTFNSEAAPAFGDSAYPDKTETATVKATFHIEPVQKCVEKPADPKPAVPEVKPADPKPATPEVKPATPETAETPEVTGTVETAETPEGADIDEDTDQILVEALEDDELVNSFTQGVATNLDLEFDGAPEGSKWNVTLHSTPVDLGVVTVKNGHAMLSISAETTAKLEPGQHHLVLTSLDKSKSFSLPWTVKANPSKEGKIADKSKPAVPSAPQAKANLNHKAVSGGQLNWGLRKSFTTYIRGLAKGDWALSGGTNWNGSQFVFPAVSGDYFTNSKTGTVNYSGTIHFTGHHGILDVTFSNPSLKINGNSAAMYLNVKSSDMAGKKANYGRVHFANVNLSQVDFKNGTLKLSSSSVNLTAEGAKAFAGFYKNGEPLDNLNSTVKLIQAEKVGADGKLLVYKNGHFTEAKGLAATGSQNTTPAILASVLLLGGLGMVATRRRKLAA